MIRRQSTNIQGFTLIELSIVLVVIGLLIGSVLVGQTLISAATVRAQITQIEKYNTAANTFREKYSELPGDIQPNLVTQFGFKASPSRAGTLGMGDGNGELDGGGYSYSQAGENLYFWEDLSTNSHLIEGGFNSVYNYGGASENLGWVSENQQCATVAAYPTAACSALFPYAKIGNGAFVYVYSGYAAECCTSLLGFGPNFFGLSFVNSISSNVIGSGSAPALTVAQAAAIDTKIDDGLPTTGNVLAQYLQWYGVPQWSKNGATPSATTCYDTSSGTAAYSIGYQNGALVNCGLSFKFQAGD